MNADANCELSQLRNEDNVDTFMVVKDESEMDKSEDMSAKGSSDITVEDRSCAANNDYAEGGRSDAEGNGEGYRMVETG